MGKDRFDASVGLAFSLAAFERYRKNGLLQAEIHHVPGIRGQCKGVLQIIEGKVTSCYIEDKNGQRSSITKEILIRVDDERGPFSWTLEPLPASLSSQNMSHPTEQVSASPRPRIVAPLDPSILEGWTDQQKLMLKMIFDAVDGQRTIEEIKAWVPFTPHVTEEGLRILVKLKVIQVNR